MSALEGHPNRQVAGRHTDHMTHGSTERKRRGRPGYDLDGLLSVSVEVFMKKGFDGTTMEDLSRRLGISKSGIYHHVASKDELLERAVGRALDGLERAVESTRGLDTGPMAKLEHLVRESVMVLFAERPFVALLLRVRGNTKVERRALERRKTFDHYAAELVREAAAAGAVRPHLDPDVTARLLFGMVNSLVEWARPLDPSESSVLADAVAGMAFEGIRTRTPAGPSEG